MNETTYWRNVGNGQWFALVTSFGWAKNTFSRDTIVHGNAIDSVFFRATCNGQLKRYIGAGTMRRRFTMHFSHFCIERIQQFLHMFPPLGTGPEPLGSHDTNMFVLFSFCNLRIMSRGDTSWWIKKKKIIILLLLFLGELRWGELYFPSLYQTRWLQDF